MQVILLERIHNIGLLGDIVNVKAGFARNHLIPKGKAQVATKANIAKFASMRAELEAKEQNFEESAQKKFEQLNNTSVTIYANATQDGKLYGSISAQDIVMALNKTGVKVDKRNIIVDKAIRGVGEHTVGVELWVGIVAKVTIIIVAAKEE